MVRVIAGDITLIPADAVVNAANSGLMGGGGVDGAIHRAGGPVIHAECMKIVAEKGRCPAGEAVITGAGNLPAKYVIHTVGPVWRGGNAGEDELLKMAYRNCLRLAIEYGARTISFPNISTGVYGFPKERAAQIAVNEVKSFLEINSGIDEVLFVCFDRENLILYQKLIEKESV